MKIDYSELYDQLHGTALESWIDLLPGLIAHGLRPERHGLMPQWEAALDQLPVIGNNSVELKTEVRAEGKIFRGLEENLRTFHPWRKGPYHVHGIHIDTEWRSDWKWDRVIPHIQPLKGRTILDVGCGNGYHCWRMAGEGAKLVVGVDPSAMFVCQFFAMKNFLRDPRAWVLPLGIEDVPATPGVFDTVFSMGVLYHRKSPIEHIEHLKSFLKPGGELVLETLVADGPEGYSLIPHGRYAKMRNVWFIPSVQTLELWMKRCGLKNIRTVDENVTSLEEQRTTDWMTFESLPDYLDPADRTKTIEGHPPPNAPSWWQPPDLSPIKTSASLPAMGCVPDRQTLTPEFPIQSKY